MLTQLWYHKNLLCYLLTPFSGLYRIALAIRNLSYRLGWKKITHFTVPVIVVGNITVGGTGKTPLVISLAKFLLNQGYRPGIISRGYKGKAKHFPQFVTASSDPWQVGDEPVLIAKNTGCPVVVSPNRVVAAYQLLQHYQCDVLLSDDGLQHTALGRDIEIAVIDGIRRFGNGFCLPAGPLREPITRLNYVDFIVSRGRALPGECEMTFIPLPVYSLQQPAMTLAPQQCTQPIHAVAGIGNPETFFQQLRELGYRVIPHPFPDHHAFKASDLEFGQDAIIIMTEKDAIKCQKFADHRCWCLPIVAQCDALLSLIVKQLLQRSTTVLK